MPLSGCGCRWDSRLPDDAPPVFECDWHRQRREHDVLRARLVKLEQEMHRQRLGDADPGEWTKHWADHLATILKETE